MSAPRRRLRHDHGADDQPRRRSGLTLDVPGHVHESVRRARNTRWSAHHSSVVIRSMPAASRLSARPPMLAHGMAVDPRRPPSDSTTSYALLRSGSESTSQMIKPPGATRPRHRRRRSGRRPRSRCFRRGAAPCPSDPPPEWLGDVPDGERRPPPGPALGDGDGGDIDTQRGAARLCSARTIRPGPHPRSTTGGSQRDTTNLSAASASARHRVRSISSGPDWPTAESVGPRYRCRRPVRGLAVPGADDLGVAPGDAQLRVLVPAAPGRLDGRCRAGAEAAGPQVRARPAGPVGKRRSGRPTSECREGSSGRARGSR